MLLLRIVFIFCCVAMAFAATGDLALYLLMRRVGPIGIAGPSFEALNRIPVFVLSALWILSGLLGWVIARKLRCIPQF